MVLRPLSVCLLALAGCPDFDGAYERCVGDLPPRCVERGGTTYEVHTVAFDDPASATFEVTPPGGGCGPRCFRYLEGTVVKVRAVARTGARFVEWAGDCSGPAAECEVVVDRDVFVRARVARLGLAFVTSGDAVVTSLGGVAGADALCQAHASDAGLDGEFIAWLSTTARPAGPRLSGGSGWVNTRGQPVALSFADLVASGVSEYWTPIDKTIIYPISYDERGRYRSAPVATGTDETGVAWFHRPNAISQPVLRTCGDLTAPSSTIAVGHSAATRGWWTAAAERSCLLPMPLYCFQVAPATVAPVRPPAASGHKRAFVTPKSVKGNFGGEAGADAMCNRVALDAGWSGDFGWRPKGSGPWYRRDGVRVLAAADGGLEAPVMFPPGEEDDGLSYGDDLWVGGALGDCNGWTSMASGVDGEVLPATAARTDGLELDGLSCNVGAYLMCFER